MTHAVPSSEASPFALASRPCVFGLYFPSKESEETIEKTRQWLRANVEVAKARGASEVYAPMEGSTWHTYRLRTDRHEHESLFWEPPRRILLETALRSEGFEVAMRYHSHFYDTRRFPWDWRVTSRSAEILRKNGFSIVPLLPLLSMDTLERLHALTLLSFKNNFLFEPIDFASFVSLYSNKKDGVDVSLSQALVDENGIIFGYIYAFYFENSAVVKTICVHPSVMQRVGSGFWSASYALLAQVNSMVRVSNVKWYVSALTADDASSRFVAKAYESATDFVHTYALFVRRLLNGVSS